MENTLNVNVMGIQQTITKGTTYLELAKMYQNSLENPIILAKQNNDYKSLSEKIISSGDITLLDYRDIEANRAYLNGLVFMAICAFKQLFNASLKVRHSIDKGLYIETSIQVDHDIIEKLKIRMQEIVKLDMPIERLTVDKLDSIKYFESIGDKSKTGLLKYNTNSYVTLYKLGDVYNFFFSKMPTSTGVLKSFDLQPLGTNGFVLLFQTIYMGNAIKPYEDHPKIFSVFEKYHEWAKIMKIDTVCSLNEKISNGNANELIMMNETLQNNMLVEVAKEIYSRKDKVKIVLMAGPSSSGKTTTCNKLSMHLKIFGMNTIGISMDDYFKSRVDTPLKEDGSYDFENPNALDLELFERQISELMGGKEVTIPTFNFVDGVKEFKTKIKLEPNTLLLIEGIHGLNPDILKFIGDEYKYKIYISPLTALNLDNHNRIRTTDNRLLRRIVRDSRTRGHSVEDSLKSWASVREGEEAYIFTYQNSADYVFNTALMYEIGVLKTYVEPLLYSVEPSSEYYTEAKRLINMLKMFLPIPSEDVPKDSLLREFIGGSCFK